MQSKWWQQSPIPNWMHYPDALCSETLAALAMAALLWRHCKGFAKPSQWLLSGIALPLWQSIRKKALKFQRLCGHCIAIFLGMKLLWWFCKAIVRDYAAIAMVLGSHCNGFAKPLQWSRWESWLMFVLHGFSFAALLLLSGLCCTDVLSCYLPHYNVVYMQSWERLRKTGWYRTERQPDR